MTIRLIIDKELLDNIDNTANQLNFKFLSVPKIIDEFCKIILGIRKDFRELLDLLELQESPEEIEVQHSIIKKKMKEIYYRYFIDYNSQIEE